MTHAKVLGGKGSNGNPGWGTGHTPTWDREAMAHRIVNAQTLCKLVLGTRLKEVPELIVHAKASCQPNVPVPDDNGHLLYSDGEIVGATFGSESKCFVFAAVDRETASELGRRLGRSNIKVRQLMGPGEFLQNFRIGLETESVGSPYIASEPPEDY